MLMDLGSRDHRLDEARRESRLQLLADDLGRDQHFPFLVPQSAASRTPLPPLTLDAFEQRLNVIRSSHVSLSEFAFRRTRDPSRSRSTRNTHF